MWWLRDPPRALGPDDRLVELSVVDGGERGDAAVPLVYRQLGVEDPDAPTLLLIHGSPGGMSDFRSVTAPLEGSHRIVIPDLPGFGASRGSLPDYSFEAHAHYLAELAAKLDLSEVHVVGFSLGGAVGLRLADLAPERVASLTLLASVGVQELELFGDYQLNHLIHGLQLGAIQLVRFGFPHFGSFERFPLNHAYARNFYDSDQRPLRELLLGLEHPTLILHGSRDFLVPPANAREIHRLVPQSELVLLDGGHLLPWKMPGELARRIGEFVQRVESGAAPTRATAPPERIEAARRSFDPGEGRLLGLGLALALFLIALATLVSEDLTCIGTGLMVASGRIGFWPGTFACLIGIFLGDVLLYAAGRFLGRGAVRRAPLRWVISPESIRRASAWFRSRGARVVFLSRFIPGLRLPSYFAAGVLRTRFLTFALYFFLAAAVWSPLLVGFASWVGEEARRSFGLLERFALPAFLLLAALIFLVQRLVVPLFSFTGRRILLGKWKRVRHWEFWPPWIFYLPVAVYLLWLGIRHRSLSMATAVNPAIPSGGFVGESKSAILDGLVEHADAVARYCLLPMRLTADERESRALRFVTESGLDYPVVAKPDVGQRGSGVVLVRNEAELRRRARETRVDVLIQEYAPGEEFGVFYYRMPDEERGTIYSVTEKRFPSVRGDGESTLEQLILRDARAVAMARIYLTRFAGRLSHVPARGVEIPLVEVGTHCLGAVFLDGGWVLTPDLEQAIDAIGRSYEGFYFGRFDLRAPDRAELQAGRGFKILELNGLTSEATSIYDPRNGLTDAYRVLFRQWRIAFEIARRNRAAGAPTTGLFRLFQEWLRYRRLHAAHADA